MSGGKYEYNPKGSKVLFSPRGFIEFVEFLRDAMKDEELTDENDRRKIQSTLDHVMSQLPSA